jgi:hypothetical protein
VVGINAERQGTRAVDPISLLREFGEGEHAEVRRSQHAERADGTREHHRLEANLAGDAGGNTVVHRRRKDAALAFDDRAQPFAALTPVHSLPLW